jgi:hypothetical protein
MGKNMRLNTEFLMILIFAHLMSDYVFQTSKIAEEKAKSFRGVIIHEIVVFLVSTIVLSIYGLIGFLLSVIVSISHLAIDYTKMKVGKLIKFKIVEFLIDQILHLGVIFLCEYLFRSLVGDPILKVHFVGFINYSLLITFMATVIVKTTLADIYRVGPRNSDFFIKYERLFDCLIVLIVAYSFVNFLARIITLILAIVLFYFVETKYFSYSKHQIFLKAVLYIFFACVFRFSEILKFIRCLPSLIFSLQ